MEQKDRALIAYARIITSISVIKIYQAHMLIKTTKYLEKHNATTIVPQTKKGGKKTPKGNHKNKNIKKKTRLE